MLAQRVWLLVASFYAHMPLAMLAFPLFNVTDSVLDAEFVLWDGAHDELPSNPNRTHLGIEVEVSTPILFDYCSHIGLLLFQNAGHIVLHMLQGDLPRRTLAQWARFGGVDTVYC